MIVPQTCRVPAQLEGMVRLMTEPPQGQISVVVGGQFGSEGKGAVAGWISRPQVNDRRIVIGVRVGGPNAGHTVYGRCPKAIEICGKCNEFGHPWALRQVPVAAVTNEKARLLIAAGSEVDPDVLADEVHQLEAAGYNVRERLVVDTAATMLMESHRSMEAGKELQKRLGSTAKGIGAARADRIFREAVTVGEAAEGASWDLRRDGIGLTSQTQLLIRESLDRGDHVVIEGTQGYGLGLHTQFYPYTTSGDCRAIDFLAQAGISPWRTNPLTGLSPELRIVVCFRPFPIRVAGNSGPMKGETSWDELELQPEFTTVTRKMRRVGEWDPQLVEEAIQANGGLGPNLVLALTMADHIIPGLAGKTNWWETNSYEERDLERWIQNSGLAGEIQTALHDGMQDGRTLLGTGPNTVLGTISK